MKQVEFPQQLNQQAAPYFKSQPLILCQIQVLTLTLSVAKHG